MNDITKRIISVTELRRNFGEITANLAAIDYLILTRGGEPFAVLKAAPEIKRKSLMKTAGAWKDTELDDDRLWTEVFKRQSRKTPVKL